MAWYNTVDASKKHRLGTRKRAVDGNEYIYGKGVASTLLGSWVSFDHALTSTLAIADTQGRVGVAMGAIDATTKFGWYCIYGSVSALCLTAFDGTNGAGTYLTGTPGSVDDTDVAGDAVHGAIGRTDRDTTTGLSTFELNYPHVLDLGTD